jgi:hypothetical protein
MFKWCWHHWHLTEGITLKFQDKCGQNVYSTDDWWCCKCSRTTDDLGIWGSVGGNLA